MRNVKKLIALMLAVTMALSVLILPSFAEETESTAPDLSINAPAPKTIFDIKNEDGSPVKIACIGDSITYGYCIDEIDREAFDKSVDALVNAKNIYIVGLGSSAILASSLNHSLRMIL